MNVDEKYQQVLKELSLGHRALVRFSKDELSILENLLDDHLKKSENADLEKVLCLIEHSAPLHSPFEKPLLKLLSQERPSTLKIFALNCARKHIISSRFQRSLRLEYDFLEVLKNLLHSSDPEIVEWTLRTIEECGPQGVYFRPEFDKIKPAPWKWFNSHQRAVREIITLLERRWSHFERH